MEVTVKLTVDIGTDTVTVAVADAAALLAQVIVAWLLAAAPAAIDPVAVAPPVSTVGAGATDVLLELQNAKVPFCAVRVYVAPAATCWLSGVIEKAGTVTASVAVAVDDVVLVQVIVT